MTKSMYKKTFEKEVIIFPKIPPIIAIAGTTEHSTNIVSNLLCIRKPSGKLRILLDSRLLNLSTVKLPCAITDSNSIYEHFSNAKYVSTLDINQAFFSIGIKTSKVPLFSFFAPDRQRYAFTKMAQGFKNSSFFMENLMTQVLSGIEGTLNYCDDIIIATKKSFTHHLETIDKVLKSLNNAKLKIQPAKIKIHQNTMNILGLTYSKGKFSIPEARSQAIRDIPVPKTLKQVRSFLMTVSYFRRYIKNFAQISLPLTELTKSDHRSFKWTEEANESFQNLKLAVARSMEITPPDISKEFFCSSDASKDCSAFLCWQQDKYGQPEYIGASSRTFSKSERSYSTFKREVLAVLQGLSCFDFVLRFAKKITLFIDARSILWLRSVKCSEPLLSRFALTLSLYDMTIHHVPGAEHHLPDYLSRSLHPQAEDTKPMTPSQADKLFQLVTIPDAYKIDKNLLKSYLTDDGLPNVLPMKKTKKTSKAITHNKDLMPLKKLERKIKLPKITRSHPFYPEQMQQLIEEQPTYEEEDKREEDVEEEGKREGEVEEEGKREGDVEEEDKREGEVEEEDKREGEVEEEDKIIDYTLHELINNEIPLNSIRLVDPNSLENQDDAIDKLRLNANILSDGQISLNTFRRAQISDPITANIIHSDQLPPGYIIRRGILIKITKGKERLALPTLLIDALFSSHHFSILGKHKPVSKLFEELNELYYHPNLLEELKSRTTSCYLCLCQKKLKERRIPYGQKHYAQTPRECWMADILDGLPQDNGYCYVLIFSCAFSLYSVLVPLKHKTAQSVLEAFKTNIIKPFGIPKTFYSDNEKAITSDLFKDFCEEYDIELKTTAPHSPYSNGKAETTVNLSKEAIRLYHNQSSQSWPSLIPLITTALNKRILSTGHTPEILMFGMKLDNLESFSQSTITESTDQYLEKFKSTLKKLHETHQQRRNKQADVKRAYLNKGTAEREFYEDQLVLLRNFTIAETHGTALLAPYIGPYVIVTIYPNKHTALLQHVDSGKTRIAHLSHLKPIDNHIATPPMPVKNQAQQLLNPNTQSSNSVPPMLQPRASARLAAKRTAD